MKIQERITTLTEEIKDDNTTSLWRVCRGIVENVSQHNKQIIAQMRDYDTHDKEHSEKVLEIIEDILGQNMEKLTVYELLLLYMSAYLHVTTLDDIAWLLNIRGNDVMYSPLVLSYAVITMNEVHLFIDESRLDEHVKSER